MHNVVYFTFIIIHLCTAAAFIHSCIYILCSYLRKTCFFIVQKGLLALVIITFRLLLFLFVLLPQRGLLGIKKPAFRLVYVLYSLCNVGIHCICIVGVTLHLHCRRYIAFASTPDKYLSIADIISSRQPGVNGPRRLPTCISLRKGRVPPHLHIAR